MITSTDISKSGEKDTARNTAVKILVITKRLPWPICYGDRLHCYELVRRLARRHEVLLVAQTSGEN